MCRFLLYIGNPIRLSSLITEPENSLIHQSFASKEREEPLNGDGFGVAWYAPEIQNDVAVFRSITPAWNNQNLRHIASVIRSGCVMAHVRAASSDMAVTELNTHSFGYGEYAFMHNGEIAKFRHLRRALLERLDEAFYELIEGTTDSECLFAHILQSLAGNETVTALTMSAAVENVIADIVEFSQDRNISERSYINIALSNGLEAVACRYTNATNREAPSLHYHVGKLYTCRSGQPQLIEADEDEHSVIVASEPLTDDQSWRVVPNNTLIMVDSVRAISLSPVNLISAH
jgi:ergothioneine biosynthesis protein EgtC